MFVPLTYYYSTIDRITTNRWKLERPDTFPEWARETLPIDTFEYARAKRVERLVDDILLDTYLSKPMLVVYTEADIRRISAYKGDTKMNVSPKTGILEIFKPDQALGSVGEAEVLIRKPNFWTKGGEGSLHMTQNYISDNWYKGGESMVSLLGNLKLYANYNDKEKVQFENSFEAKVGFNSVSSDTVRKYRVNTDQLRIYSKLGVQAAARWYYTVSGEFNTQFFNNYKSNDTQMISAFMAPANLMLSLGMDYKLAKKKFNLSVYISPFAYNLRYVGNSEVDETKHGLEAGKKTLSDYGSKLQTTMAWTMTSFIKWDSRFDYFSNYGKVEAEWENTINFVLNRYLSTKIFWHLRFDDGVAEVDDKGYFQLKELLSFGINYKW